MMSVRFESKYFTKDQILTIRKNGISMPTAIQRVNRGWTIEQAIGEADPPVRRFNRPKPGTKRNKNSKYFTKDQLKYLKESGIGVSLAIQRINRGWTVPEALEIIPKVGSSREFRSWDNLELALYKGDILVTTGNIYEIAEFMGKQVASYKNLYYKTKRGELDWKKNHLMLIEIGDDESEH